MRKQIIQESVITCPGCGHKAKEVMPTDLLIKAKPGDCCVYCSYGTVTCPPIQEKGSCCDLC